MNLRLVNIGDELLIGQVINTNAAVMSRLLLQHGFFVERTVVTADQGKAILDEIEDGFRHVDALILTGGLGPTKDDITKKIICEYFHTGLTLHQPTLDFVENWLKGRGVPMSETNRTQALVPASAIVLPNLCGTAPGLWLENDGKVLVSLPGVPHEMESLLRREVIPALMRRFRPGEHCLCLTTQTIGIGESSLSDLLEPWELSLPPHIHLAYLPDGGVVRLRLTGYGSDEAALRAEMLRQQDTLCTLARDYVWAREDISLYEAVGRLLKEKGLTLSVAESCTGGYLAHQITSIPGCSAWFKGGVVSYANEVKQQVLSVNPADITAFSPVSRPVVEQMALGARERLHSDYALATSGVAGPDGGTDENPVGTVWMALAGPEGVVSRRCSFGNAGGRQRVIVRAAFQAINLLRRALNGETISS